MRDSRPSGEVGQPAACLLAVGGYQNLRLERLPKLHLALGAPNTWLCCLAGLGWPSVLDPSGRTAKALMLLTRTVIFQPELLEDTHTRQHGSSCFIPFLANSNVVQRG